jgi:hypothetical protein
MGILFGIQLGPLLHGRHGMANDSPVDYREAPIDSLPQIWQQSQLIMWSSSIRKVLKLKINKNQQVKYPVTLVTKSSWGIVDVINHRAEIRDEMVTLGGITFGL